MRRRNAADEALGNLLDRGFRNAVTPQEVPPLHSRYPLQSGSSIGDSFRQSHVMKHRTNVKNLRIAIQTPSLTCVTAPNR